ncbi:sulfite dehydrogenase [Marinobacter zhanjiangensis]|uniref:Sulfite dehydrogenase n=1 Tax=Marinobacter zhanjiangensis TaxID=578215 RepID=A0ABQ3AR74_9GAMM|nr:sulfite dehydrogenase [Marinobacter zhanjiangensis]GGY63166.1 sulfite dehydrogenase [Marinobacter zhanjiangensis]
MADNNRTDGQIERRQFLKRTLGAVGVASLPLPISQALAASNGSGNLAPNVPKWTLTQGEPILSPPYGHPSRFEDGVVRTPTDLTPTKTSSWSFTPLQDMNGTITPNGLVFERHHGGVPDIDPDQHQLMLHGMVEKPIIFDMAEIKRFPQVSMKRFLECSGNTLTEWKQPTGKTVQDTHGLLSCCEWTGVRLSTLLRAAGVRDKAKWILAEGADAAAMTRSIPMEKALDDALVVYAQNGEALRPEQGYPLRLILPGFEGNTQIKWLRRLEVSDAPYMTREETSKYTDLMPDGSARQFTYVMEAKSVITFPSGGHTLPEKGFYEIRGLAWSGRGKVTRVDVSVDGGRNWTQAKLEGPVEPKALTAFRLPWRWKGGSALLQSRAIDETGYVQPTLQALIDVRGLNSVYHLNAIQTWEVSSDGGVSNVHV